MDVCMAHALVLLVQQRADVDVVGAGVVAQRIPRLALGWRRARRFALCDVHRVFITTAEHSADQSRSAALARDSFRYGCSDSGVFLHRLALLVGTARGGPCNRAIEQLLNQAAGLRRAVGLIAEVPRLPRPRPFEGHDFAAPREHRQIQLRTC